MIYIYAICFLISWTIISSCWMIFNIGKHKHYCIMSKKDYCFNAIEHILCLPAIVVAFIIGIVAKKR